MRDPPDPGHVPLRIPQVLGPARQGHAKDLYRGHRRGGVGRVRRARREVGQGLPRDRASVAGGVGRVHTLPRPTTSRSAESCSPPTPSTPSTPATGGPSPPVGTSQPSRPRSRSSTWSPGAWTPKALVRHDGPCAGSPPSTRSPSPSPTACQQPKPSNNVELQRGLREGAGALCTTRLPGGSCKDALVGI